MSSPDDRFAPPGSRDDGMPTEVTPTVPDQSPPTTAVPPPPPRSPAQPGMQPSIPPPMSPNPAAGSTSSNGKTIALAVLATLTAVAVIGGAFLLGRSGDTATPSSTTLDGASTTTSTTVASTTTQAPTTTAAPTTVAPPPSAAPIGDVRQETSGLFCRDLEARGYSYSAAVDYWRINGQPNQMDADKNGIPCETVYPRGDVVAYWPQSTYDLSVSYGLPGGLLCRDLQAQGVGVYDALRYYIWEGFPTRMDADGNGIPCETVYPDAAAVWLTEF